MSVVIADASLAGLRTAAAEHTIQIVGRPAAIDQITVIEDPCGRRRVAVYERSGRVAGMLSIDARRIMLPGRETIAAGTSAADLVASL